MITIDATANTSGFNSKTYFKDYFQDAGPGIPDPFTKKNLDLNYDGDKIVEMHGKDFFYEFQSHVVSGSLETMDFTVKGRTELSISGLDISNDAGKPGEFHWLVAALMGGGAPGTGEGADYRVLLDDLAAEAQHFIGSAQKDVYTGTRFDDRIDGNLGSDVLKGAGGRDTFVFDAKLGPDNVDAVKGFVVKDDTIELGMKIFKDLGKGALDKDEFAIGKADGDHAQILYAQGKLFYVDDDGDKALFAKVGKGLNLSHDDFLVA